MAEEEWPLHTRRFQVGGDGRQVLEDVFVGAPRLLSRSDRARIVAAPGPPEVDEPDVATAPREELGEGRRALLVEVELVEARGEPVEEDDGRAAAPQAPPPEDGSIRPW